MTSLGLVGVRGGCGVSSLTAGLGQALHGLGQRVLLVDRCPENLLRLHGSLPFAERGGWARALFDRSSWGEALWRLQPGFYLLPYGRLSDAESARLERFLLATPQFWRQRRAALAAQFDWLLFDLPQRLPGHAEHADLDLTLRVAEADAACHVLLQDWRGERERLLLNRFEPTRQLQRDLRLLWQQSFAVRLVPQCVHADEALGAALAHKLPVGLHAPQSLAAQDLTSLAVWCLAERARLAPNGAPA